MTEVPIFTYSDPATYADEQRQRLIDLGCSEEYAERRKQDVLRRAVKVASAFESNAIMSGRSKT